MAYRCEGCGLFCSVEQDEPEISSETIDNDGDVTGEITVTLTSACCGMEIASGTGDIEATVDHSCDPPDGREDEDPELEITEINGTPADWFEPPTAAPRYQRHYYGAQLEIQTTCQLCGGSDTTTCEVRISAGEMEQL